jgi:hypothetical protein
MERLVEGNMELFGNVEFDKAVRVDKEIPIKTRLHFMFN